MLVADDRYRFRPKSFVPRHLLRANAFIVGIAAVVDMALLIGAGYVLYFGYVGWRPDTFLSYSFVILIGTVAFVALVGRRDGYDPNRLRLIDDQAKRCVKAIALVAMFFVLAMFALKISQDFSRLWAFAWVGLSAGAILVVRVFWYRWIARAGENGAFSRRIAVVGATPQAERFLQVVAGRKDFHHRIVGTFDNRHARRDRSQRLLRVAGGLDELETAVRQGLVDDILVAMPWTADARIRELVKSLSQLPVDIRLLPDLAGFIGVKMQTSFMPGVPIIDLLPKPIQDRDLLIKAIFDRFVALFAIVVSLPLMLLIAAAIKLESPGPVLFRQKRYGFNNGIFEVKKFRSMYVSSGDDAKQATVGDPRITRVGYWLRRTSLDELPQLFNVLDGSMSLVGPRPHAMQHHDMYQNIIQDYSFRHKVKPGITGWAQVNGLRGETPTVDRMEARVLHDAYYVENWSLMFDIHIIAKTAAVFLFQATAY